MNKVVRDQMGYMISLPAPVKRIVSLVPSQTELLFDLGVGPKIVGLTKFCIHPAAEVESKVRIGGTKDFSLEAIRLLQPDLIIANKEENEEESILRLKTQYPVWISDVQHLQHATEMIRLLGDVLDKPDKASNIIRKIDHNFAHIHKPPRSVKAAYFIWRKPYMTINRDTFIHHMMEFCGFENVFADHRLRYPKVTAQELAAKKPEVLLLSTEPYPFSEKHFDELRRIFPAVRIFLVNGEYFSWYGSRLIQAPAYFNKLLQKIHNS